MEETGIFLFNDKPIDTFLDTIPCRYFCGKVIPSFLQLDAMHANQDANAFHRVTSSVEWYPLWAKILKN